MPSFKVMSLMSGRGGIEVPLRADLCVVYVDQ